MFKNTPTYPRLIALVLLSVFLAGCSLPSSNPPGTAAPQLTPESIYTAAVQTVIAQLTAAASTPGAGQTMEATSAATQPFSATKPTGAAIVTAAVQTVNAQFSATAALQTAAPQATATVAPSPTVFTPTPTKKIKPTAKPTATTASTDPKLDLGDPTFQDTFKNSDNWGLTADKHSDMFIQDGNLVMKAFNADQFDSWALTWPKTANFYIELTATPETCGGLDRYGLMLRAKRDASVGYLFGFSCDGRYSFRKWDGVKYTRDVDWTKNSAILKGADQTNRLGVKAEGDHFTLYANGVKLTDFHDASYSTGYFGVFIAAAETANFTTNASEIDYWELP